MSHSTDSKNIAPRINGLLHALTPVFTIGYVEVFQIMRTLITLCYDLLQNDILEYEVAKLSNIQIVSIQKNGNQRR